MLNMFPMPNATDPGGTRQFNNQFEGNVEKLRAGSGAAGGLERRAEHDLLQPRAVRP